MSTQSKQVILVTGVSRGIGLAVTQNLLGKGACVAGMGRSSIASTPALQTLSTTYPNSFVYLQASVTDKSASEDLVSLTLKTFKRIDGIVFNAGVIEPIQRIAELDLDAFRKLMDINLTSVIDLAQKALPHLKASDGQGRMIMVSSGAATTPYIGWGRLHFHAHSLKAYSRFLYIYTKSALLHFKDCHEHASFMLSKRRA
jgi:NAD(P)-dependent dehydrogenase (short-subunit alcohol dehydrogenase family)